MDEIVLIFDEFEIVMKFDGEDVVLVFDVIVVVCNWLWVDVCKWVVLKFKLKKYGDKMM